MSDMSVFLEVNLRWEPVASLMYCDTGEACFIIVVTRRAS